MGKAGNEARYAALMADALPPHHRGGLALLTASLA